MTYDGLNNLLQAEDSLAAGTRAFTSSIDFETSNEMPTNYIGSANIRNFNFSQGQGGTLRLGGSLNGDGVLTVLGTAGNELVNVGNAGIVFEPGNNLKFVRGTAPEDMAVIAMVNGTSLLIDNIGSGYEIKIETDEGNIKLYCDTNAYIKMSYGSSGVQFFSNGTQTALLTKEGNLNIRGALGTGVSF